MDRYRIYLSSVLDEPTVLRMVARSIQYGEPMPDDQTIVLGREAEPGEEILRLLEEAAEPQVNLRAVEVTIYADWLPAGWYELSHGGAVARALLDENRDGGSMLRIFAPSLAALMHLRDAIVEGHATPLLGWSDV